MARKKQSASSAHAENLRACACCSVRFRGDVCPQCYVAGCAHKAKGNPCLMTSGARASQGMSEFQVREAYARLLSEHQSFTQQAQQLLRVLYEKDCALLEKYFGPRAVHAAGVLELMMPIRKSSNGDTQIPPAFDPTNKSRQSIAAHSPTSQGGIPSV